MASADLLIEVFNEAKLRSAGPERDSFLAEACKGDAELKTQILSLIHAYDGAEEFMGARPALPPTVGAQLARVRAERPGERIGRYKLLHEIGEGGFGVVWMAEQVEPVSRHVALKIIKMGMDTEEVIARFEAERQALAMMDHPNIAQVFDAGATQFGRPYFVMELVKGIPITQFCDEHTLGTRERLALFGDVCSAINHAHQKGVIHRDIKPSNVLVSKNGEKPVVKVIDFGIAKATHGRLTDRTLLTRAEQFVGTPVYMSPEQAGTTGMDIDTRSDIYALGVLLYELLTGKPPFDSKFLVAAGYEEMRRIIREVEPPKPSSRIGTMAGEERTTVAKGRHVEPAKLDRLVEPDLDWIVMKAIEKDRTRRYETADGLALDIQRFLADEPVSATPPSATYRFTKFARRNKGALRVAAAIVALLVAAVIVSSWWAIRAMRAESLATANAAAEHTARAEAEAVANFLGEVFQNTDRSRGGRTVTLPESLDAIAQKLETGLADKPASRAKLQSTIGGTYASLNLPQKAVPLREKALAYYQETFGPENLETLQAKGALANSYAGIGRKDEAIKMHEEVLAMRFKVSHAEHPDTLFAMHNLADSYSAAGRKDEALRLREELLPLRRKVLGANHPDTCMAMNNLASSYSDAGRQDEALKLREQALDLARRVFGSPHAYTISVIQSLAHSYAAAGRNREALKLREEVLALCLEVFTREHANTLTAMHHLASSYSDAGRHDEALKLREQVLPLRRKLLSPGHSETLWAMFALANCYQAVARHDEALKLREELHALCLKVPGTEVPLLLGATNGLASSYMQAGRTVDAISLMANAAMRKPEDTLPLLKVGTLQVWFAKHDGHAETCRIMLERGAVSDKPRDPERAAKMVCLRPIDDPATRAAAIAMARRALELGPKDRSIIPWAHLALGMAEYRSGHYPAAIEKLTTAAKMAGGAGMFGPALEGTASYYRAMSLFKNGAPAEARKLFEATEKTMKPLPADEKNPLPGGMSDYSDLVLWLAYKEARELLHASPAVQF